MQFSYYNQDRCAGSASLPCSIYEHFRSPVPRGSNTGFPTERKNKQKNNNRGAVIVEPPEAGVMIRLAKRGKELEINAFFCSHFNRSRRPAITSSFTG